MVYIPSKSYKNRKDIAGHKSTQIVHNAFLELPTIYQQTGSFYFAQAFIIKAQQQTLKRVLNSIRIRFCFPCVPYLGGKNCSSLNAVVWLRPLKGNGFCWSEETKNLTKIKQDRQIFAWSDFSTIAKLSCFWLPKMHTFWTSLSGLICGFFGWLLLKERVETCILIH